MRELMIVDPVWPVNASDSTCPTSHQNNDVTFLSRDGCISPCLFMYIIPLLVNAPLALLIPRKHRIDMALLRFVGVVLRAR